MNYYAFHIADFALHTGHLTLEEEGVYRRVLDYYYDTEQPIPVETDSVIRRLRLGSYKETLALILEEFFVLQEDGWHNLRADQEIKTYNEKAERARQNGKNGGRPKKNKSLKNKNPEETKSVNSRNPEKSESKANQEPITKYNPEDFALAEQIYQGVLQVVPKTKKPNFEKWAETLRLMRERDELDIDEIQSVFEWANDDSFWQMNILSPTKLREQFPKLQAQMNRKGGGGLSWD